MSRIHSFITLVVLFSSLSLLSDVVAQDQTPSPFESLTRTVLQSGENRHFGRAAAVELKDGTWLLAFREAREHAVNDDGQLHILFSTDRGKTWSERNHTPTGEPVPGFPATPPGAGTDQPGGPGEPWLYRAPDGTVILHAWSVDYGNRSRNNGTWQMTSTDDGRTWSNWKQIDFKGIESDRDVFATDDHFVFDGTIYAGARQFIDGRWKNMLIRSSDNGNTWTHVSDISHPRKHNTSEVGLEYLGNGRMVAVLNQKNRNTTYRTVSEDMGKNWHELQQIHDQTAIWDRCRIWTRKHLQKQPNWWDDTVLLGVGDQAVKRGESMPRRNSLWLSRDGGNSWDGPFPFDAVTQDAGYGDMLYDPETNTYHFFSYHGTKQEAKLVQYTFTLNLND